MNIINVQYNQTGKSQLTDNNGMREMQQRAYAANQSQYILLKSPPASGKSRALMFIGLEKLKNQNIKKVIVAVPERSIAKSFSANKLSLQGFHSDWEPNERFNLCSPGGESRKVEAFKEFMRLEDEKILICTHSTLRFAFDKIGSESFNNCLLAIDEFHHVSADYENKLGELLRDIMRNTNAHIIAMTGSYFRGDSIPVLMPEDEIKFTKVTYNYYEQLDGYKYMKSLGIGFHFYQEKYIGALKYVLDLNKKTIIHIPSVNSGESTKEKLREVDQIFDIIGTVEHIDAENNIFHLRTADGRLLKVADLVNDDPMLRSKTINYLRNINNIEDIDIILALGMAKEGFDWPYCEHALTIGYRGSLTEIIQIIGRCTRDSMNKEHAQFTNLIAEPDAESDEITNSVNNILKAITASLLMEEVLAPKFKFNPKINKLEHQDEHTINIKGLNGDLTDNVKNIIMNDLTDLKARILQDSEISKALPGNVPAETINKVMIPKIIREVYPELDEEENTTLSEYIVAQTVLNTSSISQVGNKKFIQLADKFINVDELDIDLIMSVNPFQNAFEVLSKSLTPKVFKAIQQCIRALKIKMTDDEAVYLWPKINEFVRITGKQPNIDSLDPAERRMAEAIIYLKQLKLNATNAQK
ncbi:DEAD/DEAH box helicase family protein [Chitinophaga sancti]|uniref:DEAD/DEAH box helicase n=1 Tax=Chitinophaga sancti TaxID=1004 RepID=UPI002A75E3D9|nr:DEAD/DEAH box helicase [Chitinophaga sancti]WPQ63418.1 DEAD/DEAH box helicase family protein [Chitinophaga sancti]